MVIGMRDSALDQGTWRRTEEEDSDAIMVVVEKDDVKEAMLSNHGGHDVAPRLLGLGMTQDGCMQWYCRYRVGER